MCVCVSSSYLPYLYTYTQSLQPNQDFPVSIPELEEALREIEADGAVKIQYLSSTQMIIVR